jgi:AraC family transcriptional regulator
MRALRTPRFAGPTRPTWLIDRVVQSYRLWREKSAEGAVTYRDRSRYPMTVPDGANARDRRASIEAVFVIPPCREDSPTDSVGVTPSYAEKRRRVFEESPIPPNSRCNESWVRVSIPKAAQPGDRRRVPVAADDSTSTTPVHQVRGQVAYALAVLHVRPVFTGPLVRVADVICCAPRGGCGAEEHSTAPQVVVPRRGVFTLHRGQQTVTVDAMTAVVLHGEYRVSHPADGGDRCTVLAFAPELHEEALRDARILRATQRLAITHASEQLEAEEQALHLLAALAAAPPLRATPRVQEVRELLAARPTQRWTLTDIGLAVHASPYHLARQFRAATGQTIARHLLGLRLALALDRLQEGEDDLARLAADLGFAGHSHFTERFRRAYGTTPSQARKILTARRACVA